MRLSRIPQQVSNSLAPLKSSFTCAQGQHFRVFCWLLVTMIVIEGGATLKNLCRLMPRPLAYSTVLRMMRSRLWDSKYLILELSETVLYTLPPSVGGLIHVVGDLTTNERTGKKQSLARKMRAPLVRVSHRLPPPIYASQLLPRLCPECSTHPHQKMEICLVNRLKNRQREKRIHDVLASGCFGDTSCTKMVDSSELRTSPESAPPIFMLTLRAALIPQRRTLLYSS